ncbi:YdcH family protein [Flavobacterium sp.]|uniref:YdcH family protein n=1 Tax=Flavobacterium sp. TaxID=239 RepID=UPI003D0D3A05
MERHPLLNEFPEYTEKMHTLKTSDNHFKKLFDEYHEVEHEINKYHSGAEATTDEHLHELKAKLLFIKDEIFAMLKN